MRPANRLILNLQPRFSMICTTLMVVLAALWSNGCVQPNTDADRAQQLALDHYQNAEYTKAISMFETALEHNRESPELYCWLGRCNLKLADQAFQRDKLVTAIRYSNESLYMYNHACEAFPGYLHALEGKADALKRKGDTEAALALADWAADSCGPRAKMYLFQAREYAEVGDADMALTLLRKAIAAEPKNPAPYAELGRFQARYGNRQEAIDNLRKAHDLDPTRSEINVTLAALEAAPYEDTGAYDTSAP